MLDKDATPDLVLPGALVLQPNDERRRSGSHYTPRELTEPIVRHTLAPVLAKLCGEDGRAPTPAEILDLKVCDPAMGSGAFLVETCRQLADALIEAWGAHGEMPAISRRRGRGDPRPPPCGTTVPVRNRPEPDGRGPCQDVALAEHVGARPPRSPSWTTLSATATPWSASPAARSKPSTGSRTRNPSRPASRSCGSASTWQERRSTADASGKRARRSPTGNCTISGTMRATRSTRCGSIGDLALAAFFAEAKPKQREAKRLQFTTAVRGRRGHPLPPLAGRATRTPTLPSPPFHWELEFPEVFDRENPGFDAFVGNPPVRGKNAVAAGNIAGYPDWLKLRPRDGLHEESHGNADLVAHFYRRAFNLIRNGGTLGLIATNTIAQGDTRSSGLRWICEHGGEIYRATKRPSSGPARRRSS